MLLLDLHHGFNGLAIAGEREQHAVAQHLHHLAPVLQSHRADPLRQFGDGLGGAVVAQCLEHGHAASQIHKCNRQFCHGY
ncbi:hypothetical protein FQZ97_1193600 [compost metagenome]